LWWSVYSMLVSISAEGEFVQQTRFTSKAIICPGHHLNSRLSVIKYIAERVKGNTSPTGKGDL
jgi:hypothetical protein